MTEQLQASPDAVPGDEPPYRDLRDALFGGYVVPFLGSAASLNLIRTDIETDPPTMLPSGAELARLLADRVVPPFPSLEHLDREDLTKVASWYAATNDRTILRMVLRNTLAGTYQPGPLHELLASVPTPLLIVTTNYDTLLEQAFVAAGKPYDLVVYPADRTDIANALLLWRHEADEPEVVAAAELYVELDQRSVIYKMHGTLAKHRRWDNFVITEDDYVQFLVQLTNAAAVPPSFYVHVEEGRDFLFLGYSLRDWNTRVVLRSLRHAWEAAGSGATRGWAIQRSPTPLERQLWLTRGVKIFDVDLEEFTRKLAAAT